MADPTEAAEREVPEQQAPEIAAAPKPNNDAEERLKRKMQEIERLHEQLKAVKDVDVDEYQRLRKEAREREERKLQEQGEFEKLKEKWNAEREQERERLQRELAEREARLLKYERDDKVREAAIRAGVSKDDLADVMVLTRDRIKLEDGKFKLYDADGTPLPDDDLDAFFAERYKAEKPKFYEGRGSSGAGTPSNGSVAPHNKTKRRSEMSRAEKAEYALKHGVDALLQIPA